MVKKVTQKSLMLLLTFVLAISLLGSISFFQSNAAVVESVPFYDNPYDPTHSTVEKAESGEYKISQNAAGGNTRLFYGDYTSGVSENPYYVDLTDFKMDFSVDKLAAGGKVVIGFMAYVQNGAYTMQGYGQGLAINLNDDGGGNTGFTPTVTTFAYGDTGYTPITEQGNQYLVYNNASPRTSYLGKKMKVHVYVSGENLNIHIEWVRDDVNSNTAYDYSASIALSSLPSSGANAFDYTKAHMIFTNDNSADGADFTVYSISDKNSDAYYASMGGMLNNSIKYTAEYVSAVKAFSLEETTGKQVKDYYGSRYNFDSLNASQMRKPDKYEYEAAKALSTEGFDEAALAVAEQVFAGYGADTEISDMEDAFKVYTYYVNFEEELVSYADTAANIREALAQEDFGQLAVAQEIDEILSVYAEFDASKYFEAKARYDAAVGNYNQLSAFAKSLISDKYEELTAWFQNQYDSFYITDGSYFTSQFEYDAESDNVNQNKVYAHRNGDGTTTIRLPDDTGLRLVYGTDIIEGTWEDYTINPADFSMTFSLDSFAQSGRFSINFTSHRSALPWGNETNPGLSIFFRADFSGANTLNVSLAKTAGGSYPTKEEVPEIQNEFGTIGTLFSTIGRFAEDITIRFKQTETGYEMTVSMGSTSAMATLSNEFMKTLFTKDAEELDYTSLVVNMTVGEGVTSFNGGEDTVLTIKSINDDYARNVEEIKREAKAFVSTVTTLAAKDAFTFEEIRSFNSTKSQLTAKIAELRIYEKVECEALLAVISEDDLETIDTKAVAFVRSELEAVSVTIDNFEQAESTLATIAQYWNVLSEEQKALYAEYQNKFDALAADVEGCGAAKAVIDSIETLAAKVILPSTVDALRLERDTVKSAYEALDEKYAAMVSNYDKFTEYSAKLDSYYPADAVVDAIDKLFEEYATLTNSNLSAAKTALADVKAAYEELTEGQKAEVSNYARIAEFEQKIADFEQYNLDYAIAFRFDKEVSEANTAYATITAENRAECLAEVERLKAEYEELTQAQKEMLANYGMIADIEARVAAYDADVQAQTEAQAVIDKINAIGTVVYTDDCKAKIDAAGAAYDALSDAAKAKVTNLETLTNAQSTYAQLKADAEKGDAEGEKGCKGSLAATSLFAAAMLVAGAVVILCKKKA